VVVITGASGGIGRATARAFARPGVHLALLARGAHGLEAAKRDVESLGADALTIPTDVADFHQVERAAQRVVATWGAIDLWINNAMVTVFAPATALSPQDLCRVTEVTYLGAAYGTRAALDVMRPRNRGVIVQVGSALAYRAIPLQAAYCGAKHALRGYTDSVRCELRSERSRIHITMVHLSAFNTPQFDWARNLTGRRVQPVPPIFEPELAARAIVWAASHRRREWFVGWPSVKAVVVNKLWPSLLDAYLARTGIAGQVTNEPRDPESCENLYAPCDADQGARGRFSDRAHPFSFQWLWSAHRRLSGVALLLLFAVFWLWYL
jgi:NAD(P)-dependent dehydrogenase (short-subunit alcohol dehydrogenase family)